MNSFPPRICNRRINSRKEIFHFVFVHWVLFRMTKSRRELAWNVARMGEVGNTHRMLGGMKKIFTYNLDERMSSKITCRVSLLEMTPLERCLPSGSSQYTRSIAPTCSAMGIESV
jgi:hypothetical protein